MKAPHAKGKPRRDADAGFSLIEVIVALVLLGIVATAALYFFLQGTRTTSSLQRSQNAVAIANQAMERAYAVNPQDNPGTGVGGLVVGRAKADVEAAWASVSGLGIDGLSATYPLWDGTASTGSTPVLPLSYTSAHSGQEYSVTTLVGSCFRGSSVISTDQACGKLAGVTDDPGSAGTPSNAVRMLRVIAVVTWEPLADECGASVCSYHLSGLVDRSEDLEWNQIIEPVAVDDFESFDYGETRTINVLANDLIGPVTSNPVLMVADPPAGQGEVLGLSSNGLVNYRAPANASGKFTFSYRIKDARGAVSLPADVEVTLFPESANDTARVLSGQPNPVDVLANDRGSLSAQTITITGPPSRGSVTVSGVNVTYQPGAGVTSGGDGFTYTYTDAWGQESLPAQVNIVIDHINVQDHSRSVPMRTSSSATWVDLTSLLLTGNTDTSGWTINVSGAAPGPDLGTLRVGSSTYTGSVASGPTVSYNPPRNRIGEYTFSYSLTNDEGLTSLTRNVTLTITGTPTAGPVAVADDFSHVFDANRTINLPIGANDDPTDLSGAAGVTLELGPLPWGCGSYADLRWDQGDLDDGELRIRLPNINRSGGRRTCTFQYTLEDSSGNRSETVTATYRFER